MQTRIHWYTSTTNQHTHKKHSKHKCVHKCVHECVFGKGRGLRDVSWTSYTHTLTHALSPSAVKHTYTHTHFDRCVKFPCQLATCLSLLSLSQTLPYLVEKPLITGSGVLTQYNIILDVTDIGLESQHVHRYKSFLSL